MEMCVCDGMESVIKMRGVECDGDVSVCGVESVVEMHGVESVMEMCGI